MRSIRHMTADQALKEYGSKACTQAYELDSNGYSCCHIAINTGIPKHHQGAAILAGEHLCGVEE